MEGLKIIELIGALGIGGIVGALLLHFRKLKKFRRGNLQSDNDNLRKDNEVLRDQIEALTFKIADLRIEIANVRSKVILLESANIEIPLPMLLKTTDGKVLSVNKKYEEEFLHPNKKFIHLMMGKDEIDIWGRNYGDNFKRYDEKIREEGEIADYFLKVPKGDEEEEIRCIKSPQKVGENVFAISSIFVSEKKVK